MQESVKQLLQQQFGASLDMLGNAISMCPDDFWDSKEQFGYMAFHTIFFLDYYLSPHAETFKAPAPFVHSEFMNDDEREIRTYTKEELLWYLNYCRDKLHSRINGMINDGIDTIWQNQSKTITYTVFELMLYNMRHVQHHSAQMNLLLRQRIDNAPDWISREGEIY